MAEAYGTPAYAAVPHHTMWIDATAVRRGRHAQPTAMIGAMPARRAASALRCFSCSVCSRCASTTSSGSPSITTWPFSMSSARRVLPDPRHVVGHQHDCLGAVISSRTRLGTSRGTWHRRWPGPRRAAGCRVPPTARSRSRAVPAAGGEATQRGVDAAAQGRRTRRCPGSSRATLSSRPQEGAAEQDVLAAGELRRSPHQGRAGRRRAAYSSPLEGRMIRQAPAAAALAAPFGPMTARDSPRVNAAARRGAAPRTVHRLAGQHLAQRALHALLAGEAQVVADAKIVGRNRVAEWRPVTASVMRYSTFAKFGSRRLKAMLATARKATPGSSRMPSCEKLGAPGGPLSLP